MLLILATLAATILIGCGAGSVGSSQQSAGRQAPGQKAEGTGPSEQGAAKPLGHPTLGSADAPVVLTEYGDYQ